MDVRGCSLVNYFVHHRLISFEFVAAVPIGVVFSTHDNPYTPQLLGYHLQGEGGALEWPKRRYGHEDHQIRFSHFVDGVQPKQLHAQSNSFGRGGTKGETLTATACHNNT